MAQKSAGRLLIIEDAVKVCGHAVTRHPCVGMAILGQAAAVRLCRPDLRRLPGLPGIWHLSGWRRVPGHCSVLRTQDRELRAGE